MEDNQILIAAITGHLQNLDVEELQIVLRHIYALEDLR